MDDMVTFKWPYDFTQFWGALEPLMPAEGERKHQKVIFLLKCTTFLIIAQKNRVSLTRAKAALYFVIQGNFFTRLSPISTIKVCIPMF